MLQLTKKDLEKIIVSMDRVTFNPEVSSVAIYRQQVVDCLYDVFGYTSLFWLLTDKGQLKDPAFTNIEDRVLEEYFTTYYLYDVLAPHNMSSHRMQAPIIKIKDIMTFDQFRQTDYSINYFARFNFIDEMGLYMYDNSELIGVIGVVRKQGEPFFSEKDRKRFHILGKIIESGLKTARLLKGHKHEPTAVHKLTVRELEIVELVRRGLLNKEIGHELAISVNTVKKHLQNIFQKIEVENRTELGYYLSRKVQ